MHRLKLLIVDDNVAYCTALEAYFASVEFFDVLLSAYDGFSALERIAADKPDAVILDMIMPELDGLGVLHSLNRSGMPPNVHIFANSPFADDFMVRLAQDLGASYFFLKPMQPQYIMDRIMNIFSAQEQDDYIIDKGGKGQAGPKKKDIDRELLIGNYLRQVGIPVHVSGYKYLKAAVDFCADRYGRPIGVTTEIYPYVALLFQSSEKRVERNIRHSIEHAWNRGNIETQHKLFGYTVNDYKGRPTNKEFIALITDRVVMHIKYR